MLRDVPLGGDRRLELKAVAWVGRHVFVLGETPTQALALLRVDPDKGSVVASHRFGRWTTAAAATRSRFVLLLTPRGRIASARLVVASGASVRTIGLPGIRAGSLPARPGRAYTVLQPGVAVSPSEPRAWVVGAERSAEVNLRTGAVRYRGESRHPAAALKEPVVGSAREARWLSDGRLVVTGWDASRGDGGKIVFDPTGLRLLETASWSDRIVHPRALLFYVRDRRLLTIGPGEPDCANSALTAYTLSGLQSYRVCEARATGEIRFAGRYARLGRSDGRVAVVDLDTGALVARTRDLRVHALDPGGNL